MNDITFIKGQGASKRVAAGEDFISGLVLFTASLPSGFTTTANIKQLFSLIDAENAGIASDYNDATPATGSYQVTTAGTTGDVVTIYVTHINASGIVETIAIGSYTKIVGDNTVAKVATAITAAINASTPTTGYSSTAATDTSTIIAPKRLGIYLNTGTPITVTLSSGATLAGTITQFSGGAYSKQAVWHYHIAEAFRLNPSIRIWLGLFPVPAPYTFVEITTLQTAAGGKMRQVAVFKDSAAYASADLTLIDGVIKTNNDAKHKPLSALYAANMAAVTDITTVADLALLTANKASSIIGQDGAALGNYLFLTTGKSVTQLGAALGALSLSAVSEDFGEPAKFNISNGIENDVPAFANGKLLSDPTLSDAIIESIDTKRHIFGLKYVGFPGTFFNDNHCAIIATSDYAFINDNRVIDKACRGVYAALIPYLKSKLLKNSDGTLAQTTIAFLQTQALAPLYQMARDQDLGEVSPDDVYIDPSQNVTSTNTLVINIVLNENGIARNIQIPISFK